MSKVSHQEIVKLIARVCRKPESAIQPHLSFRGDLHMDSLQSLDLLVMIEEDLKVVVPQNEAVKIQTVQQLFDFLDR